MDSKLIKSWCRHK